MSDIYHITDGFDYFVGELTCPKCNSVSPADETTNIQTYIRDDPKMESLGVGDDIGDSLLDMEDKRYIVINPRREDVSILESWNCPFCGHFNWVRIDVRGGRIVSVSDSPLTRASLAEIDYATSDIATVAAELSGKPYLEVMVKGPLEVILDYLP